jgi:hypothetical protein
MPNNASRRHKISDYFEPVKNHTIFMLLAAGAMRDAMPPTETPKTAES